MKIISMLILLLSFGCTSIVFDTEELENGDIRMNSTEDPFFGAKKEKLSVTFSTKQGGNIKKIHWDKKEVLVQLVQENFPGDLTNFTNLSPNMILDDDGLLIIDTRKKDHYQLRRSYSLSYDKKLNEHILEVIYNVKNYSSSKALASHWELVLFFLSENESTLDSQTWQMTEITLPQTGEFPVQASIILKSGEVSLPLSVKIETPKMPTSFITGKKQELRINRERIISPKSRLSWKILYRFKH